MSAVAGVGAALFCTAVAGLPCASLDAKMWHGGARTSPTELSHSLRACPGLRPVQYSAALILPWLVLRVGCSLTLTNGTAYVQYECVVRH